MPAEVSVDEELVAALIADQHPDCQGPVRRLSEGWDNVVYRVGEDLLARMPRRAMGADNLRREQANLPLLPPLPLPIPLPVRHGRPGRGYPYPWSLVPWIPGSAIGTTPVEPEPLAELLRCLHVPSDPSAPTEAARAMPLLEREAAVIERMEGVDARTRRALETLWADAVAAEPHPGPPLWCHGDLHPYNLLQQQGRLCGVVDWGDLFGGDPSPDLAGVWMLFDLDEHELFRRDIHEARWRRGRGWAIYFAVTLLDAARRGASAGFGSIAVATLDRLVRAAEIA